LVLGQNIIKTGKLWGTEILM